MKTAKSSLLLLPLFGLALLAGCNKTEEPAKPKVASVSAAPVGYLEKIKARDKLIVGVFTDKPPFGFVDEAGRYVGFDTDIGRQFAKDLLGDENKVEFVAVEPASRIPFLQSDKVDLILANMTVTPERKEAVDFTNPNLKVAVQALVPQASSVKSELRDWVNVELAKLGEEKFLLKLYDQYVRKELSDDTKPESVIVEGGEWQG